MTKNITWGWTGQAHDASLAVFSETGLEFASHSERYSRIKNDICVHRLGPDKREAPALDQPKPRSGKRFKNFFNTAFTQLLR